MWLLVLLVLSVLFIIGMTARFKVHPLLALTLTAVAYGLLGGMSPRCGDRSGQCGLWRDHR